ncbi:MAG: hypothetical protein JW862_16655 [Anaerolineales bacterium]|nr:hypothetical protein [Anaerolineales bacterium]
MHPANQVVKLFGREDFEQERVFAVFNTAPDVQDAPGADPLPPIEGQVRFEKVNFAYQTSGAQAQALHAVFAGGAHHGDHCPPLLDPAKGRPDCGT